MYLLVTKAEDIDRVLRSIDYRKVLYKVVYMDTGSTINIGGIFIRKNKNSYNRSLFIFKLS